MRRHKKYVARKCQNLLFQRCARPCVKSGRRLVQHDQTPLSPKRARKIKPPLLAAGERVLLAPDPHIHGRAARGVPACKSCIRKRLPQRLVLLCTAGEHADVVADGGAEYKGFLRKERDLPAEICVSIIMHGPSVDLIRSLRTAHGGQHV